MISVMNRFVLACDIPFEHVKEPSGRYPMPPLKLTEAESAGLTEAEIEAQTAVLNEGGPQIRTYPHYWHTITIPLSYLVWEEGIQRDAIYKITPAEMVAGVASLRQLADASLDDDDVWGAILADSTDEDTPETSRAARGTKQMHARWQADTFEQVLGLLVAGSNAIRSAEKQKPRDPQLTRPNWREILEMMRASNELGDRWLLFAERHEKIEAVRKELAAQEHDRLLRGETNFTNAIYTNDEYYQFYKEINVWYWDEVPKITNKYTYQDLKYNDSNQHVSHQSEVSSQKEWPLGTSQEHQEMYLALSHAPSLRGYQDTADGFMHYLEGSPFHTKWSIKNSDTFDSYIEWNRETAKRLREHMDADCMLAFDYVQGLFISDEPLPLNMRRSIWVNLDDIIKVIGWAPRTTDERHENRLRIYQMLYYVHYAEMYGRRNIPYQDMITLEEIPTVISTSPWQVGDKEWEQDKPQLMNLFQSEPPLRVELTQSREWTVICENPFTKQLLNGCESVGQIPGNQPVGAWARVIFVRVLQQWNIDSRFEWPAPTRRELIDTYPAKKAPLSHLLAGKDPNRIVKYWREAILILIKMQIVAETEEATATSPSGYLWIDKWLDTPVRLLPGPRIKGFVEAKAKNKPAATPRRIPGQQGRRGRRKRPST